MFHARRLLELCAGLSLAWLSLRAGALLVPAATAGTPAPAPPADAPSPPGDAPPAPPAPPPDRRLGPAYDSDASMAKHAQAIAGYTLRASLDPSSHTVHGEGQILWRNGSRVPQREIWLHLYANGFKNDKTLFNRVSVGPFRGLSGQKSWGYIEVRRLAAREMEGADLWPSADKTSPGDPDDQTDIRVPLPREVAPGASITLDVAWDLTLPPLTFRSGHFGAFHMIGQWFPKLARLEPDGTWAHFAFHRLSEFYADFGSYDVTVDTPDNVVVGATGQLVGETRSPGRIARRFVQDDVHDFGFAAWDDFQELDATSRDGGVAIRCLYPRGNDRSAAIEVEAARAGLQHFGERYGAYPYRTLTLVHPPDGAEEAGGMEYPTLITTGGTWLFRYSGVPFLEIVTLHELGHQWFYGMVATDEHRFPFLDEGINSYAEVDVTEALFPMASGYTGPGLRISLDATNRMFAVERESNVPVAQAAADFQSGSDYGVLIYQRTAAILRTFGRVYGEDKVQTALGRYARRYRFEHPGPEELLSAFAEVLGDDAAQGLRAALFDRATVDYAVASFFSEPETGPDGFFGEPPTEAKPAAAAETPVEVGQIVLRRRGALRFPVEVALHTEDGAIERITWEAKQPVETLPYRGKSHLVAVVIDPDHKVLLDDNLANNAQEHRSARAVDGAFERALFHVQAGLGAVLP